MILLELLGGRREWKAGLYAAAAGCAET